MGLFLLLTDYVCREFRRRRREETLRSSIGEINVTQGTAQMVGSMRLLCKALNFVSRLPVYTVETGNERRKPNKMNIFVETNGQKNEVFRFHLNPI